MAETFAKRFSSRVVLLALCLPCLASPGPFSGTAPFFLEGNRVYAELAVARPDGTFRTLLAFVDLGSPTTIVSEALFKELQLDQKRPLTLKIGDLLVGVDSAAVSTDAWLPFPIGDNRKVEAILAAGVMQNYQVVIDYANRTLTLAQPGTLRLEGVPVAARINEQTGLVALDISVNGEIYPITLDNGSAYTWLRKTTAQEWLAMHPDWQRGTGAVGLSNMRMADDGIEATGTLLRISEIKLGSLSLRQVGALAIGPSTANWDFMDWYSKKNPLPVIGWLGGNILRGFRITIDYPNRMTYWLPQTELDPHDLDQVGLTLMFKGSQCFVAAVVTQHGRPTVEGVQAGDKLLQIDALRTNAATWGAIFSALHGKPGALHTLLLGRGSKQFTVQAPVTAF